MQTHIHTPVNTLRLRQNDRHLPDNIFKTMFLNETVWILIYISLKFNNISALVQIRAWRRPGDKPLFEAMMVRLAMHICVTQPQWVNSLVPGEAIWHHGIGPSLVQIMDCHLNPTWTNANLLLIGPSSCSCLCPIHWSQVLNQEWRCSWSSANRRCSDYIWVIKNFIAFPGATYITGLKGTPQEPHETWSMIYGRIIL